MTEDKKPTADKDGDQQPVTGAEHRNRMRHDWHDLIEDLIEDARQRGVFDALAGEGKPLDLDQNLFEGSSALANRLMRDNDLRPAWISNRMTIHEKIDSLRSGISRTWDRYRVAFDQAQSDAIRGGLTIGWDDACRRWEEEIEKLNKEIESYNLKRPMSNLEIYKIRLNDELDRAGASRYLL
jgi:DnaJ homolog subfamily C member 28